MSTAGLARLSELDRSLDDQAASSGLAEELFALADLFGAQAPLRNALADPSAPQAARTQLVHSVLAGRVSQPASAVVASAVGLRWSSAGDLVAALERQAVRAALNAAALEGALDQVEDELFRFARIVAADSELRSVLGERTSDLAGRQEIVEDLLRGRSHLVTRLLARRAVLATERTFDLTVAGYLSLAAGIRDRAIAKVTVARPLSEEHAARLREVLARQVGREVTLQVIIDPEVIGGARVRIGDEIIDGTVSGKLDAASRQLT